MATINTTEGQTLTDIALQEYGCVEGIFILMEDNPMLNMDGKLITGQAVQIREAIPELTINNKAIATELKASSRKINTGTGATQESITLEDDIVELDVVE